MPSRTSREHLSYLTVPSSESVHSCERKGHSAIAGLRRISVIVRITMDMWRKLPPLCPPENNADETPMASDSSTKYFFVFRK